MTKGITSLSAFEGARCAWCPSPTGCARALIKNQFGVTGCDSYASQNGIKLSATIADDPAKTTFGLSIAIPAAKCPFRKKFSDCSCSAVHVCEASKPAINLNGKLKRLFHCEERPEVEFEDCCRCQSLGGPSDPTS